jgi:hypothetical protein
MLCLFCCLSALFFKEDKENEEDPEKRERESCLCTKRTVFNGVYFRFALSFSAFLLAMFGGIFDWCFFLF